MSETVNRTRRLTVTAMLAAVATLLMYLEFPLPLTPPFLKIDLSGIAILMAAFLFGPLSAVLATLVKDLVHLLSSTSGGVGQLADFIILSPFAVTASLIYRRKKDKTHALIGLLAGTAVMVVVGVLANRFLLIPFYSKIMPVEAIVAACEAVNPAINSMDAYYLFGAAPFNLVKGLILSAVTMLSYKKLSEVVKRSQKM